jgi:hypothetical protein
MTSCSRGDTALGFELDGAEILLGGGGFLVIIEDGIYI